MQNCINCEINLGNSSTNIIILALPERPASSAKQYFQLYVQLVRNFNEPYPLKAHGTWSRNNSLALWNHTNCVSLLHITIVEASRELTKFFFFFFGHVRPRDNMWYKDTRTESPGRVWEFYGNTQLKRIGTLGSSAFATCSRESCTDHSSCLDL